MIEVDEEAMATTLRSALACPDRRHHGIDFKNPFTMSKRAVAAQEPLHACSGSRVFISGKIAKDGGAYRDRTDDLMLAKQPLSQLS